MENIIMTLYNIFKTDPKRKERFDIILEPLQAITQLALMAFCPRGSKLTISNNLLTIQVPGWGQAITRSYNNDKRDDLFFLFNAIARFNRFYSYLKTADTAEDNKLFDLLVKLGKIGIDNIIQTYSGGEQASLLHTLQMYRTMLDKPELFAIDKNVPISEVRIGGGGCDNSKNNIDGVFIQIRELYSVQERSVVYNMLILLEKRPEQYECYMNAINSALTPVNYQIKKWINDNIVY